jgi:hypothetical protein
MKMKARFNFSSKFEIDVAKLTFNVAVGIMDPPDPPIAISNFESFSIIVGVIDDKGLFPGPINYVVSV